MQVRVTKEHKSSYPNPVNFVKDELLELGVRDDEYPGWIWVVCSSRRKGWAPEQYIEVIDSQQGKAIRDYTAFELDTNLIRY